MSFIHITFIMILFITLIIYWNIRATYRNAFLLFVSIAYYCTWNPLHALLLIAVVAFSWVSGMLMKKYANYCKIVLAISIGILIVNLAIFKYCGLDIEIVGISFFTFHTISYLMDVYRGDVEPEHSFINYALFVTFFPQILSGPIAKSKVQLKQYHESHMWSFDYDNMLIKGLLTAGFGFFMKLVIADRLALFVNAVYNDLTTACWWIVLFATFMYTFQIYCDFAGYSLIAIGMGKMFGFDLPVNFRAPYLACSINDFWKRWHISLTSWFRDYVYFPLGGNRKGSARTYLNVLIVFALSGVWHGVGLTFLIWGMIHGLLQCAERAMNNIGKSRTVKNTSASPKIKFCIIGLKWLGTFLLVSFAWVFFRADSVGQAVDIFAKCFDFSSVGTGLLGYGISIKEWILLGVSLMIVFTHDWLISKGYPIIERILLLRLPVRWVVYWILLFGVLVFGLYGPGYDSANFIYTNF